MGNPTSLFLTFPKVLFSNLPFSMSYETTTSAYHFQEPNFNFLCEKKAIIQFCFLYYQFSCTLIFLYPFLHLSRDNTIHLCLHPVSLPKRTFHNYLFFNPVSLNSSQLAVSQYANIFIYTFIYIFI